MRLARLDARGENTVRFTGSRDEFQHITEAEYNSSPGRDFSLDWQQSEFNINENLSFFLKQVAKDWTLQFQKTPVPRGDQFLPTRRTNHLKGGTSFACIMIKSLHWEEARTSAAGHIPCKLGVVLNCSSVLELEFVPGSEGRGVGQKSHCTESSSLLWVKLLPGTVRTGCYKQVKWFPAVPS